jgi:dTDP-glucose 4,6-dehydratase
MPRLLITGGAGFIGTNFVHYWLAHHPGDRVVVLDALTYAGNVTNLDPVQGRAEFRFLMGDIGDTPLVEALLREERIDTIVHFAAESHVDRSIAAPDAFLETNIMGTHSLLKAARRVWLDDKIVQTHRFHHVSTDEVYGSLGPDDAAFTETTPYAPNSPYSASKASSDHLVRAYHHTYGLHTTVSNCSNNYGPYQFPEKLIPLMILKLLSGGNLPVYGDGLNVRDWLHVEDHCRGIEAVLERGRVGEVYNIGGRSECENIVLVKMLCALIDEYVAASAECRERFPQSAVAGGRRSEQLIEYVKDRPGHDRRYAIDCSKIEAECGFRPTIALGAGLRSTIAWYLEERRKPASQLAENVLLKVPGCELVMGALPGARLQ